ncbi:hypothetical protein NEMBOFW57_006297 [Staphylotrichum longicolle]|uniref:Uncharacterized protein n=1 Tax=Staphylotrichum longicolle TaxID=669026 RepID=A0AAD4I150_9PEZI|nr:hypothetical protein NEMBOFW57_006297 [Staphylotrichum longicolle]
MVGSQGITLESLPAELRCHIIAHLAHDLQGLNALVSASPVFYQQYLLNRKALLRTGLEAARGNLLVDAYAVEKSALLYQQTDSRDVLSPEAARQFIDEYVALRAVPPDVILQKHCTEENLLGMAAFYDSVAQPLTPVCATLFLNRLNPCQGEVSLSATESARLLRALYRYQLYCNLFGEGTRGSREVPELAHGEHLDLFFCLFKPWEIEEIYCHWGYVFWDRKRLIESKGIGEILREREVFQQW